MVLCIFFLNIRINKEQLHLLSEMEPDGAGAAQATGEAEPCSTLLTSTTLRGL